MVTVQERERIRRAYYVEGKSMRQIEQELRHSYWTIRKALTSAEPTSYTLTKAKPVPVLGPYKAEIERLLAESEQMPRKQRYTSGRIYQLLREKGYTGSESGVRRYVGERRRERKRPELFVPLEFDPGQDAQVDWGDIWVEMDGTLVEAQLFVMRLCYSRKVFAMAFPTQRQECFWAAHVAAFQEFGGVPHRLIYDNLKTAVKQILEGKNRQEQDAFIGLRSHYLFESRFCTPGKGNQKGGVENGVGYVRRRFLAPTPKVASFAELNAYLLAMCRQEDARQVDRQPQTIGDAWRMERAHLRFLPATDYVCFVSREVTLNGYSQVTFETNRYSVPVDKAQRQLTLRAFPFHIEVLARHEIIARHERSYTRKQDILDPLHYLPLLAARPGAFEHAKPLRQWRQQWPQPYELLLVALRQTHPEAQAVREFIGVLQLHQQHDAALVEAAVEAALAEQMPHREGVRFCLNRLLDPTPPPAILPQTETALWADVALDPVVLSRYDHFLTGEAA